MAGKRIPILWMKKYYEVPIPTHYSILIYMCAVYLKICFCVLYLVHVENHIAHYNGQIAILQPKRETKIK